MRYPSGLRIHCVKDEGKKKLMVPFKTAHNTISCQKQNKRQTKTEKNPTNPENPNNTFSPYFPSALFPLFLRLKLCSPVTSAEMFNLKCTISGFYKSGGKSSCLKDHSFLCIICNLKQAKFSF